MRIELQVLDPEERSKHPAPCWLCNRKFTMPLVAAWAYSTTGALDCGPVCPQCLEEGPVKMQERLDDKVRWSRWVADDDEMLAGEGIEAPTIDDYRAMEDLERSAARQIITWLREYEEGGGK